MFRWILAGLEPGSDSGAYAEFLIGLIVLWPMAMVPNLFVAGAALLFTRRRAGRSLVVTADVIVLLIALGSVCVLPGTAQVSIFIVIPALHLCLALCDSTEWWVGARAAAE
ncbi:hypothetical protein [Nocardia sp. NPDC127526]|uniref:hypothetical protein n=1 Tax=Nocardia sp. NPDC127526 TaxID=3345393 RepID=UPI00364208A3